MQALRDLAAQVMDVYEQLSEQFSTYQSQSGLTCSPGCGACCNKPDIEVTPLEMLPYAFHLFDQGLAESTLSALDNYNGFACMQYQRQSLDGTKGYCGIYHWRPGLCRMFGAAGYTTKSGGVSLSVCREIKHQLPEKYANALIMTDAQRPPMLAEGQARLAQLDPTLGGMRMPINDALKFSLEKILMLACYAGALDGNEVA